MIEYSALIFLHPDTGQAPWEAKSGFESARDAWKWLVHTRCKLEDLFRKDALTQEQIDYPDSSDSRFSEVVVLLRALVINGYPAIVTCEVPSPSWHVLTNSLTYQVKAVKS